MAVQSYLMKGVAQICPAVQTFLVWRLYGLPWASLLKKDELRAPERHDPGGQDYIEIVERHLPEEDDR